MHHRSDGFVGICSTTAYQKVVQTIQQMDTALPKTMRVLEMNYVETEKYNSLYTDIGQSFDLSCSPYQYMHERQSKRPNIVLPSE